MSTSHPALAKVIAHARETKLWESISAAIEWDERTYMPPAAGPYRAEQITRLAGLMHQRRTEPQLGEWLVQAAEEVTSESPTGDAATTVRIIKRDFDKQSRLPQALVEALARNSVEGQQAWVEARKQNNFSKLAPYLQRTIELKREQSEAVGYEGEQYDAMLDDYEPDEKTARVRAVFSSLRDQLVKLLEAIQGSRHAVDTQLLKRDYPIDQQREVSKLGATRIGFDFGRGRLDVTNHPFCTELGPDDVRLTTRYEASFFNSGFFGTLHEAGHGIYQLGLRTDQYGLPPGCYCSMAIHESQSRLYENIVGRSWAFWQHFYPELQQAFPGALGDVEARGFFEAVNHVTPSLIRVEADEVTYNLHIIVRFELEQELLAGNLQVSELPEAWNAKYKQFLGILPPNDADGVLQDVHWSAAYIGYFPTYALGNLYAAQFYEQADRDLGGLEPRIRAGKFSELKDWMIEKIHQHGRAYTAGELVQHATGSPLSEQPLIRYLSAKMNEIYQL